MTTLVLVVVDALRKDVAYGDRVDTPSIDRLMERGTALDHAYANGPATAAAFPAILASSRVNDSSGCPDTTTVAAALQEEGFETIGISTNPNAGPYYGYDRGFDEFVDFVKTSAEKEERSLLFRIGRKIAHSSDRLYSFIRKQTAKMDLPYERAETLNEAVFDRLSDGTDQFLFIHYMEPHYPYLPPAGYVDEESAAWQERYEVNEAIKAHDDSPRPELTGKMWTLYGGEVRYLDEQLGALLDRLDALDDDTVILFTADHGDQFGEHGSYLHSSVLYNVQMNVPFIVDGVDVAGELASHLDIGPTLLGHVDGAEAAFDGIDLAGEERDSVSVALDDQRFVATPQWKLLDDGETLRLFDIDDYLEDDDLAGERPEVVEELAPMLGDKRRAVEGIDI
ncbi:MAG: sulfatase-like hydrolase/transferase [Candidatus Nanohaloarchaea archaeon]|nr:sulfatase-like hydrolase/transferase [Candidatus Nanohaloarchaea archaeon]